MKMLAARRAVRQITAVAILFLATTAAVADGAALAAQCVAQNWDIYINCQRTLLDVRAAGNYCVPQLENGARYQHEFVSFMRNASKDLLRASATNAARAYFDSTYRCD